MKNKEESKKAGPMTLEDIVFMYRNKEYGAYWLRKRSNRYLIIAFIICSIAFTTGVAIPFIMAKLYPEEQVVLVEEAVVTMEVVEVDETMIAAPPPPPPMAEAEASVRYTAPVVVDEVTEEMSLAITDDVRGMVANEPVPDEIFEIVAVEEEEEIIVEEEPVFIFVEEEATFRGGTVEDFRNWVQENLVYPPLAIENNVFGRVTVQFAVNSQGEIVDVVILRGVDPLLDNETRRIILSSPRWSPARQGGSAVKQQFTMPVVFTLLTE